MQKKTAEERFFDKIRKDPVTGCWLWTGCEVGIGYGTFWFEGKNCRAHRWSYMTFVGDPGVLFVCHACDEPGCVNPDHLFLGSAADNMQDAKAKGRLSRGDQHYARTKPERLARGDRNGARLHPERMPRGDRNGSRTRPERCPRGDRHGSRTKPERWARGEDHSSAKLTWESVRLIRARYAAGGTTYLKLADEYSVSMSVVRDVVKLISWVE